MTWLGPRSILGECPRWDTGGSALTWVDIDGGTLHHAAWDGDRWQCRSEQIGAPLAGAVRSGDAMVLALGTDLRARRDGQPDTLRPVEAGGNGNPLRLNEMVTDPTGRIWVGSMAYDWTLAAGSIYRVDLDGRVTSVIQGLTIANGIGWSPDATTMYTTDTHRGRITAWDFDPDTGRPSRPRPFLDTAGPGRPDGMAVDIDGNVWSAIAGAGYITCISASGAELHRERVPVPVPTSCCFAGPGRDRLIVTTSRKRLDAATLVRYPESGRTWDAGRVGATGVAQLPFAGAL